MALRATALLALLSVVSAAAAPKNVLYLIVDVRPPRSNFPTPLQLPHPTPG